MREGVRLVRRKDGSRAPTAFVVARRGRSSGFNGLLSIFNPLSTLFPHSLALFHSVGHNSHNVFQIGDSLREARTRRGFSPADVHKAIRIRERYLTALEEERWDMLPGEVYTKGFLRTYSEHLGLNGQLYIDEYNARIARHDEEAPPFVPHASVDGRHLQRGVLVTLAAILVVGAAVAGLAAWRLAGSSTPPRAQSPSGAGSVAAAAPPKTTPATTAPVISTAPVFTSISAARGRCWLLVRAGGPNGKLLFEGVLEQGQAKRFQVQSRLWMRMGRPSALDITLAGKLVNGLPSSPSNVLLSRSGAISA
jgi:cytoskeleton protein RodZ